ncbi:MAG: DUF3822 family protein [Alistipes sp.]
MRLATGKNSNNTSTNNKVSIQLKLGGHSFSWNALPADLSTEAGDVEFVVLTHQSVVVPQEQFEPSLAANYLRLCGMPCNTEQTAVYSDPQAPIIAVMAIDSLCLHTLQEHLGGRVLFTSPLLTTPTKAASCIWLYRADDLLYIKVYDGTLRLAEVMHTPTDADVLYYIARLSKDFSLDTLLIDSSSDHRKETQKSLKRYFKQVLCE